MRRRPIRQWCREYREYQIEITYRNQSGVHSAQHTVNACSRQLAIEAATKQTDGEVLSLIVH